MTAGPRVTDSQVIFRLEDADRQLASAAVYQEVRQPRLGPEMLPVKGGWTARIRRPPVDRLEYLMVLRHREGGVEWVLDPANPCRADGPFGVKSVVEMPGYRPPRWLVDGSSDDPPVRVLRIPSRRLRRRMLVQVWTSPGGASDHPLPLLLVNDGPEYARFSELLRFLSSAEREGRLPPHHVALLQPNHRDEEYSANPAYAAALLDELMPEIEGAVRVRGGERSRAAMGASLGGLAMLHAQRLRPELASGLFLQSSSFFRDQDAAREGRLRAFSRVARFVEGLVDGPTPGRPVPAVLTCGAVEENLAGNRLVRDALAALGYPVLLVESRDAHNWTSWRDSFEPHLIHLLQAAWG